MKVSWSGPNLRGWIWSAIVSTAVIGAVSALGCEPGESSDTNLVAEAAPGLVAVHGPGLGNLTYAPSEVFTRIGAIVDDSTPRGGHGNVVMVNGYLATIYTLDGGGSNGSFAFWDVSNPRAPVRAARYDRLAESKLREAHGFGLTNGYPGRVLIAAQSTTGFQVWDWSDVNAPFLAADVVLPGVTADDYGGAWWVAFQAPFVYLAGGSAGLFIVDLTDLASPVIVRQMTNTELGIPRVNQVHVVGNLMIANFVENGTGISLLDISDPRSPVVKYTSSSIIPTPYATQFNGGRLVSAGKYTARMSSFNVVFDANNDPSGLTSYSPDVGVGLSGGGYLTFHEGFVHAGFSNRYVKFDMSTFPVTQVGAADPGAPYNGDLDFAVALGNLAWIGNDHGGGSALIVHQAAPDTTGPSVTFVSPRNGAANQRVLSRVGLTFSEAVELSTLDTTSIIVRPPGGAALTGKYSTQQNGIVNFWPDLPLDPNTTYEVVVPAGGVRDYVGNAVTTAFRSTFTTGAWLNPPPAGCSLGVDTVASVGTTVAFSVTGCTGNGLAYSWDFGDGSARTAFSAATTASHAFSAPRHYPVRVTARNVSGETAVFSRRQTITYPVTVSKPTRSTTIVADALGGIVAVVNTDGDTVAAIDAASPFTKRWETAVGRGPRTLAFSAVGGELWTANQEDATVSVLDASTGAMRAAISLPYASRPFGITFDPSGSAAYVTLEATGRLLKIDAATRAITANIDVGPRPRGVAVSGDGARIFVTRFLSPTSGGEVREIAAPTMTVARTLVLPLDLSTVSSEADGPGLPNYLQSITITPDGRGAWVPSKKDNIFRGIGPTSDGIPLTPDSRVRTMVSKLDLVSNGVRDVDRRDINNADLANAVEISPDGWAFVTTQGDNHVEVYDALTHDSVARIDRTGRAPRGLVLVGNTLFVQNFLSRDVAIYDVSTVGGTNLFVKLGANVSTQAVERLSPIVLLGKQTFYDASDPRMSREAYLSCASCHLDGGNDGQVWDFTQDGEGLRNTTSLLGSGGVSEQGPVHWTGNFDEIQDFEIPIREAFGGTGFLSDADFVLLRDPLGAPKAGRSVELDALATYVTSLTQTVLSPYRNADGTMTADAMAGQAIFESPTVGCASCHSGREKTDSRFNLFHDVGTAGVASGTRLGRPLVGLDTPTLVGVFSTAPYLHDGSAPTLLDVITTRNPSNRHGTTTSLNPTQQSQLVAYLQQLDDMAFHVAAVLTTNESNVPTSAFSTRQKAYWRVRLLDQRSRPVLAASVTTTLRGPDGAVWSTQATTTDVNGWASFSARMYNARLGQYSLTVTGATKTGLERDRTADARLFTTFTVDQ